MGLLTAKEALQQLLLRGDSENLNFTGKTTGKLTLIGYGHGHYGHFILETPEGDKYPVAGHTDGTLHVKTVAWANNIPNYPSTTGLKSGADELVGSLTDFFDGSTVDTIKSKVNLAFTAVGSATTTTGGTTMNTLTGGTTTTSGNKIPSPEPQADGFWSKNKKWALPTIIGLVVIGIGGAIYAMFKK